MDKVKEVLDERFLKTARAWWKTKRPVGWTIKMHDKDPTVNCENQQEADLARCVSAMIYYKRNTRINPRKDGGE